ncbi:hypothetical protein [Paenibacillus terrigena]|nr:hypothetical protein [Paenibacillus terrigena]
MEPKPIKIKFKECARESTLEQILDELVKDAVKRIVMKYEHIVLQDEQ